MLMPAGTNAEEQKLRVMPLGDSITDGFTVVGGYRIPLWYLLQEQGIVDGIDFVGPNGWYIDGVVDYNHAGYSGYTIADCPGRQGIYNFIDTLMQDYPADVVMLQIGTNDIISSYDLDHAGERLELLVDSILTYIPEGGLLYVSTIPYMDADVTTYTDAYTVEEMDAAVDDYNAKVKALVAKKQSEGKPVAQADVNSVLTKADLSDGVHPSEDGYKKMAEYWCGVLTEFVIGTPAPTQPASTEPTETTETTAPTETTEPTESTEPDKPAAGDVNGDGQTDVTDIIILQKYLLGLEKLLKPENADLHQDGVIDIYDLGLLKRDVLSRHTISI
jgi:lysophospholipase L1-like esterase